MENEELRTSRGRPTLAADPVESLPDEAQLATTVSVNNSVNNRVAAGRPTVTVNIPLQVSISIGTPQLTVVSSTSVPGPPINPGIVTVEKVRQEGLFGKQQSPLLIADLAPMFSLPSLATTAFDWRTALSLATASMLSYRDEDEVHTTAKDSWKLTDCLFRQADDTQCFLAISDDSALIAFRGTQEMPDWLSNLNTFSTQKAYGAVHRGFYYAFDVVKTQLEALLDQLAPRTILLTGHSLGGAIATIAAAEWADTYPISGVYTFGQPAVGKGAFSSFMDANYNNKFFRFVNNNDIVPRVPPTYKHIGTLYHFDARHGLKPQLESIIPGVQDDGPDMLSQAEFDRLRARLLEEHAAQASTPAIGPVTESLESPTLEGLPSVSDHSMSEYIRKIEKNVG